MKKKKTYEDVLKTDKAFVKWARSPFRTVGKIMGVKIKTWKKPPKGYEGLYQMLISRWDSHL